MRPPSVFLFILAVSLLQLVSRASAEEDIPNFEDFGQQRQCPDFRCGAGMSPVPKARHKFTSTGCGSMGGGMVMMGKIENNQKVYESCCDQWHACYQVCGVSKQVCDDAYKTCSAEICGADEDCKKEADLAGLMISIAGCHSFDRAQFASCECVPKDKVQEMRKTALARFYKKNAPDQDDKAAGLAAKADTKGKMAALFRKLLVKYPTAIEKVEDPQQAMYKKMMEDAEKAQQRDETSETEEVDNNEDIQEL